MTCYLCDSCYIDQGDDYEARFNNHEEKRGFSGFGEPCDNYGECRNDDVNHKFTN